MTRPTLRHGDPLLGALDALLTDANHHEWEGEPAELLAALRHRVEAGARLPGDPAALSGLLRRQAAVLAKAGFVATRRKSSGRRLLRVQRVGDGVPSLPSVPAAVEVLDVRPVFGPPAPTAEQLRSLEATEIARAIEAWPRIRLMCPRCHCWLNDPNRAFNYRQMDASWDGVHDRAACDLERAGGVGSLMFDRRRASEAAALRQFAHDQAREAAEREVDDWRERPPVDFSRVRF